MTTIDVSTLAVQFGFEIIPDCPAATELGYTAEDRLVAQVLTGPVFDANNFYYSAYSGNLFSNNFKSGLFIARSKTDGTLVYATNTQNYSLDTGNNFLGAPKMVTRSLPVVTDTRVYLTSGWISNIGPQLFCLDKATGNLIYAIAYYLPEVLEENLGVRWLTTQADYSVYNGSNCRVSTFNPLLMKDGSILCGVSSLQNVFNPGLEPTSLNYVGYPYFTDQGFLFKINTITPSVIWRSGTSAPLLHVGDVLTKGCAKKDPFAPDQLTVVIATLSADLIKSPGKVEGRYYFAQKVSIEVGTPIVPELFAPFWNTLSGNIFLDADKVNGRTLAQTLPLLTLGEHTIYYNTNDVLHITDTSAVGSSSTNLLWYTKSLKDGERVNNRWDANALNYWGNDVWGASATYDKCTNVIYSHSGQTHCMPLDEIMMGPSYVQMKQPLVIAADQYVANQTPSNLAHLNAVKDQYQADVKTLCLTPYRSPRGQMSYCDAVLAISNCSGRLLFAARSLPLDVYTFLGGKDPKVYFFGTNDADGDASSGVFLHQGQLGFTTKNGIAPILDVSCINKGRFDHKCLEDVGVVPKSWIYTGPNGVLGGSNYQSTQHQSLVFTVTANNQAYLGSLEYFVTREGLFVPRGQSVALALDLLKEEVIWNVSLGDIASGSATYTNGAFLTANIGGKLFALKAKSGEVVWEFNSGALPSPMRGGVASPSVDTKTGQVFWISSYNVPGNPPSASATGYVFQSDPLLDLPCEDYTFLNNRLYNSLTPLGSLSNFWTTVNHRCGIKYRVVSTLNRFDEGAITTEYSVVIHDKIATFTLLVGGSNLAAQLITARFINQNAYLLTWYDALGQQLYTTLMSKYPPA